MKTQFYLKLNLEEKRCMLLHVAASDGMVLGKCMHILHTLQLMDVS